MANVGRIMPINACTVTSLSLIHSARSHARVPPPPPSGQLSAGVTETSESGVPCWSCVEQPGSKQTRRHGFHRMVSVTAEGSPGQREATA